MNRPHPRLVSALSVLVFAASLSLAGVRLRPRAPAFDPCIAPPAWLPPWRVDLDHAPVSEIEVLPGVGPRLADRIVRDRESHGPFHGVRGLDRVPGVGPALIERVAPFVR